MTPTDHQRLLVKTARLYYEQSLTQAEIAERLRLSRPKVQRLLEQARSEGIAQISIRPIMGVFSEEERALEEQFGLREAVIVETSDYESQSTVAREVGAAAAEYLVRIIQPGDTLVISWGGSLLGMVNALAAGPLRPGMEGVTVVQGLGGLGDPTHETHAADLTRRLALALGGQAVLLPAPGVAGTRAAGQAFLSDPFTLQALKQGAAATLAFMGIGAPRPDSILIRQGTIVSWPELDALQRNGAVGDINLRYFDHHGHLIASDLNDAVIGLTLDEIGRVPRVVGVAGGAPKLKAIRAALEGRLVNVLVTDHLTAKRLLGQVRE